MKTPAYLHLIELNVMSLEFLGDLTQIVCDFIFNGIATFIASKLHLG